MNRIRTITLAAALAAGLGGQAVAAGTAPAPQGATAMAGQLLMSQLAGGLADPVPIVASPMGLMFFTIELPGATGATGPTAKPHTIPRARTLQTRRIGQPIPLNP